MTSTERLLLARHTDMKSSLKDKNGFYDKNLSIG